MQTLNNRKRSTEFTAILTIFELVSFVGLVYSILVLFDLKNTAHIPSWQILVYVAWFATSVVCVYAMLSWKKWGAYGLGIATLIVTVVDLVSGSATWGGASLGLFVAIIVIFYLRSHWNDFD